MPDSGALVSHAMETETPKDRADPRLLAWSKAGNAFGWIGPWKGRQSNLAAHRLSPQEYMAKYPDRTIPKEALRLKSQ